MTETPLHLRLRRFHLPARFTGWYIERIAGRYCPCEWPVKIGWLIEVCAWIDDEEARHDLIRFAGFHLHHHQTVATGATNIGPDRIRFFRTRHNGTEVEK